MSPNTCRAIQQLTIYLLILRVACRIGRPFAEPDTPPFAGVALNKFMPPIGAVPPKLNAPALLPPGVAVDAELLELPNANGDDGFAPIDGGPV